MHPYAWDRLAQDRAEQLCQLAQVRRIRAREPSLPSIRFAVGRLLVGLGERLQAGFHGSAERVSALHW
jgi:hypothetical protein